LDSRISLNLFLARANTHSLTGSIKPPKGVPDKSKYFFSYIIATQLSAQKHRTLGQKSASNLASNLAYRFLSNALQNGSVESVRLEGTEIEIPPSPLTSSRDRLIEYPLPESTLGVRGLPQAGPWEELIELLTSPNDQVRSIMDKNSLEFTKILLDTMEEERMWTSLWDFCLGLLPQFMVNTLEKDSEGPSKGTTQAATDWAVWKCLMNATSHLPEAK